MLQQRIFLFVAALCLAVPLFADTDPLAIVARSVHETDQKKLESLLAKAILSPEARVRAVAARVINVRKITPLLDHVRARLDSERDLGAAREEIRAAIMLAGVRELDRALFASERLGKVLDDTAAMAVAHLGQPALDAYFTTLRTRNIDKGSFFVAALWGRSDLAPSIATRLMAEDGEAFQMFLFAVAGEPDELLDTNVFTAALANEDADIRTEMIWYLVNRGVTPGEAPFDPKLKAAVMSLKDPNDDPDFTIGLELLRRILGTPKMSVVDFRRALGASLLSQFRIFVAPRKLMTYIAEVDRNLVVGGRTRPEHRVDANVRPLPFIVPSLLPNGVAPAVLKSYGCNSGWMGEAMVRADKIGRIIGSNVDFVAGSDACRGALQTLIALSVVDNVYVASPFETSRMSMVQAPAIDPCFDEGDIGRSVTRVTGLPNFRMPRMRKGGDPELPPNPARKPSETLVELVIAKQGCVRTARVLRSIDRPTDEAILRAAHQWQFQPASYEALPVDFTMLVRVPVK